MAGIYIHIPFCRRACHYCDFHFTTNLQRSSELVDAIVAETDVRADYLEQEGVQTIYFGGGTPSLLATSEIERILNKVCKTQSIQSEFELTLEANPEDLTREKLLELKSIGINRLSLGTQSFIDTELKWMNRMHAAEEALICIQEAQNSGFDNISIDLIFGLPNQSDADWNYNLKTALSLDIQHISSYSLTVEPKTVLNHRIEKEEQQPPDDKVSSKHFETNMRFLPQHGFEHYEISNFAKDGFISQHNSSYWQGKKYLGLGPSAHSFNGSTRQWNIKSNAAYIQKLLEGGSFIETETLTPRDKINEHIMTGLRTKWGIQKSVLDEFHAGTWKQIQTKALRMWKSDVIVEETQIYLTNSGKLKADLITSELFI